MGQISPGSVDLFGLDPLNPSALPICKHSFFFFLFFQRERANGIFIFFLTPNISKKKKMFSLYFEKYSFEFLSTGSVFFSFFFFFSYTLFIILYIHSMILWTTTSFTYPLRISFTPK